MVPHNFYTGNNLFGPWVFFIIFFLISLYTPIINLPIWAPPNPQLSWFEHTWSFTTLVCFHTSPGFSCPFVFENIFRDFSLYHPMKKINLSIRAQPYHRVSWYSQLCIYTTWKVFHISFSLFSWSIGSSLNKNSIHHSSPL